MIEHSIDIGREYTLIRVVHLDGGVCPPQERLRQWSAVRYAPLNLQIGTTRAQRKACHALLMEHALHLIHPYRHRAVFVLHDIAVDGRIGTGTMVLRPVEFNAARNPGTCQTHQRGFDDVVVIHEMALFDFVIRHLDTSAQLRQNHHLNIFVLQPNGLPFLVLFLVADRLNDRIRINNTT